MLIVKCTLVLEIDDPLTRIENNYNYELMLCEEVMSSMINALTGLLSGVGNLTCSEVD